MDTQKAQELLQSLLEISGFVPEQIELQEVAAGEYLFNVQTAGGDNSKLIGRNGDILRAFQIIVKNVFRSQGVVDDEEKVRIDVDSYRQNQESHVLKMAERQAQRVLDTGRNVVLPPMSPFFRRLVHLHIKDQFPNLETFSKGRSHDRSVCIALSQAAAEQDEESVPTDIYAEIEF